MTVADDDWPDEWPDHTDRYDLNLPDDLTVGGERLHALSERDVAHISEFLYLAYQDMSMSDATAMRAADLAYRAVTGRAGPNDAQERRDDGGE